QDEMIRIIQMVEEGKISSEEASELISALKEDDDTNSSEKNYMGKHVKIRIGSANKEKVRVNIPIRYVKWILKTGYGIASSIIEAKLYIKDNGVNLVIKEIDNGVEGKIIDLDREEGESIAVYIE